MSNKKLFDWLVKYHSGTNLRKCIPYITYGRTCIRDHFLEEGLDENELYRGVLIVANGSDLATRLKDTGAILDERLEDLTDIPDMKSLFKYLNNQRNNDGAYVYDSKNRKIVHVRVLANNPEGLDKGFSRYGRVPRDFVSHDSSIGLEEMGTKTILAMMSAGAYHHTETFQIKRTGYTPLGIGKVTHFNRQGLVQELFFEYAPLVDGREGIVGVYRRYRGTGEDLLKVDEKRELVYIFEQGFVGKWRGVKDGNHNKENTMRPVQEISAVL